MPFSDSQSCKAAEWTEFFETVLKPAVEAAQYRCRRSAPTRGSLIKGIVRDLSNAWVVLADLTDHNANVFYELGVRHALENRTILIAQHREDIPFDLRQYANHVYDWRTTEGRKELAEKLGSLFNDVDQDPDRQDNPVSDFLETPAQSLDISQISDLHDVRKRLDRLEAAQFVERDTPSGKLDLPDASPLDDDALDWFEIAQTCASKEDARYLRRVLVRVQNDIQARVPKRVAELSEGQTRRHVESREIPQLALEYEEAFLPTLGKLEAFTLGLATSDWKPAARAILKIAGQLSAVGGELSGYRFVVGLPSFFALRLCLTSGAMAMHQRCLDIVASLINDPIPVVRRHRQPSLVPLVKNSDLFHSESLLGHADLALRQIAGARERSESLQKHFASDDDYWSSLGQFMTLVAMRNVELVEDPLYPAYVVLPHYAESVNTLVAELASDPDLLNALGKVFDRSGESLRQEWPSLAEEANRVKLDPRYHVRSRIPTTFDGE